MLYLSGMRRNSIQNKMCVWAVVLFIHHMRTPTSIQSDELKKDSVGIVQTSLSTDITTIQFYLNQAENLFEQGLYNDSIHHYQKTLDELSRLGEEGDSTTVSIRIAQSYLLQGEFLKAIDCLKTSESTPPNLTEWKDFTLSLAYRYSKQSKMTIELLESASSLSIPLQLQLAIAHFEEGNLTKSKDILEKIISSKTNNEWLILSTLYLAKIAQKNGQ